VGFGGGVAEAAATAAAGAAGLPLGRGERLTPPSGTGCNAGQRCRDEGTVLAVGRWSASKSKRGNMGATPWRYFVPFEASANAAFANLRKEVAGAENWSPEDAMEDVEAAGSAPMLLNMMVISDSPGMCSICPLAPEKLQALFGTTQPTRGMIESNRRFYDDIERGQGVYIVAYRDGKPDEYFFAGYSFD
jgi:hypothetical protein